MNQEDLHSLYLRDVADAPGLLDAIREAAKRPDRTLVLQFPTFDDNPILLYAVWGLARSEGVTIVLSARG